MTKIEERLLCKSCGKEFHTLSLIKNCPKCIRLYRDKVPNIICRRCKIHHVSRPTDPMCGLCYFEVENENKRLVELYHMMEGLIYEKTKM